VVNAGSDGWNYQVKTLAEAVAKIIPGVEVSVNTAAQPDRRSYKVDFARFRQLAPNHQPQCGLPDTITELRAGLEGMHFHDQEFRKSQLIRLNVIGSHRKNGLLNDDLRWTSAAAISHK
jgi:hypothetical protein